MDEKQQDLFPILLLRDGDAMPEEPVAFVVGNNGAFVKRENVCFRAVVPTNELPMLAPVQEGAKYLLPPMPAERVKQILLFFRAIWEREKSEAILLISYHVRRGTFRLDAPEQHVSGGHVNYDMPRVSEGFVFVGTVHSHGSGNAYHSSVDLHDEEKFDGIHLTFGHVDRRLIDIVATLAVGGRRFLQPVERVLDGTRKVVAQTPKKSAHRARVRSIGPRAGMGSVRLKDMEDGWSHDPYSGGRIWYPTKQQQEEEGYLIEVPVEIPAEEFRPPIHWSVAVHAEELRASFLSRSPWVRVDGFARGCVLDKDSPEDVRSPGQEYVDTLCGWLDPEEE
mgnify:CR=1 FL=1